MLFLVYSFIVPVTKKVTFKRKLKGAKLWSLRSIFCLLWLPGCRSRNRIFVFQKNKIFYSVPPVGVNPSGDGDTKPRVSKRDSRVTKGGKKMFKKTVVLAIVMVMLVSFSAAVLAEDNEDLKEGKALKNNSGVVISVDENDKVKQIEFLEAVPKHAVENGNPEHPDNPIAVAGD
jgi:hypothetical protein